MNDTENRLRGHVAALRDVVVQQALDLYALREIRDERDAIGCDLRSERAECTRLREEMGRLVAERDRLVAHSGGLHDETARMSKGMVDMVAVAEGALGVKGREGR